MRNKVDPRDSLSLHLVTLSVMVLAIVCAYLSYCPPAWAQTSQGITGAVTDPTGAVIRKAKITVHSQGTGIDKEVDTTTTGNYSVPFLAPGVYDVRATADGFQAFDKTNITVLTDQMVSINFSLLPGSVSETVTVNASEDVLDYAKADRGDVVENTRIEQLPILAANPFNLAGLSAGALNTLAISSYQPFNQTGQSVSIHGQQVEFNIDGSSDASMTGSQNYAYTPSQEAVQEFKITTNAYDAAQGRSAGGSIDMTLKTGTKILHGEAYELMRRGFLDADSSINDANIVKNGWKQAYETPKHTMDKYGIEADGQLVVPKLWGPNRKTFFLLQFDHINDLTGTTSTGSVPTAAMLTGDFSALLTANGAKYNQPIYDPSTEATCTANNTDTGTYAKQNPHACRYQFGYGPGAAPGPQGNPVLTGTPNVIPNSQLNSTAKAIMSWFPLPNQTASPSTTNDFNGNYGQNNPTTNNYKNYLLKIDQAISANDSLTLNAQMFTNYGTSINGFPRENVNATHPGVNWAAYGAHFNNHMRELRFGVGETHIFSPSLINSLKVFILITDQTDTTGPASGYNPTNLGFSASLAANNPAYFDRFPSITFTGYNVLGSIPGLERGDNELAVNETMNYTHGNHSLHFGFEARPYQYSQRVSNSSGNGVNLAVGKGWTQQWDISVAGGTNISSSAGYSGNSLASMLVANWDSGNATAQPMNYYSLFYGAAFIQDDWRVRPNLTVNFGVRWDKPINGNVDRLNRQVYTFDTTDVNPINSMVNISGLPISGSLLGGITYAGVNGNPRAPFGAINYDFGPRAGFAYTLNQKTVIRGGVGVYYNNSSNQIAPAQTGFGTTTTYSGTLDGGVTPEYNLSSPFPNLQTATGNCGGVKSTCLETNAGQSLSFINPTYRPPLILNSSFGFERQLTKWDTVEVSYVGMRGYNGTYSDDINHISAAAQAACDPERGGNALNCTQAASGTPKTGTSVGYVTNPFYGLALFAASGTYYTATTIQKINFSRPFPIFTSVTENNLNGTKSWYNAAEVTYNHRTSVGLTLHATYTYSKQMGSSPLNSSDYVNRNPTRNISSTDNPHRFTVSAVYELPVGKGRRLLPGMNRIFDAAIGGWQVGNILLYQSGFPVSISGYEINKTANGGYILPRKRFYPGQTNPYWSGNYASTNSYIQAFKPCVGIRDTSTGVVTLEAYSTAAGCTAANFVANTSYTSVHNVVYTGIRLQRIVNDDANISKNFEIYRRVKFQLRMDAFNVMNHTIQNSSSYDTTASDSNFGTYQMGTAAGGDYTKRQIQLTGRLTW